MSSSLASSLGAVSLERACSIEEQLKRRVVTVKSSLTGQPAWGPTPLMETMTLFELKSRVQEECNMRLNEPGTAVEVLLMQDGRVLSGDTLLSEVRCRYGEEVELELVLRDLDKAALGRLREKVRADWRALAGEASALASDPEVVLMAVKQDADALKYATEDLRSDTKFVTKAVAVDVKALCHVNKRLLSYKPFVKTALKLNWRSLQFVAKNLKTDTAFVMMAVVQDVAALQHADEKLTNDLEFMVERVLEDWQAVQYASNSLLRNHAFVRAATAKNVKALEYIDASLLADRAFMLTLIQQRWSAYQYADQKLKDDPKITAFAVDMAMNFVSAALRSGSGTTTLKADKDMALEFAAQTCRTLRLRQEGNMLGCRSQPAWKMAGQNWKERKSISSLAIEGSPSCASAQHPFARANSSSALVHRLRSDVSLGRALAAQ